MLQLVREVKIKECSFTATTKFIFIFIFLARV